MSLGALDFGLIVDGTLIIVENCILRLAEAQHQRGRILQRGERFEVVTSATREVFTPALVSVAVIVLVNLPIFALTGVEGKMFKPVAFALIGALIFTVTFVPAACALLLSGRIQEKDNFLVRWAKRGYAPLLAAALKWRWAVVAAARVFVLFCGLLGSRMGAEFIPNLDEGDVAIGTYRPPSTGIEQAVQMQLQLNRALMRLPEVKTVFARNGTAEVATDLMPPGRSGTFVMLKDRADWPDSAKPKAQLLEQMRQAAQGVPGGAYEFTQPIELRFNELISGVRSDLAVEQVAGLSVLTVAPQRTRLARYGLNVGDLQDAVSAALGGRGIGLIYEGDARYPLVVRLSEDLRTDPRALERLPLARPGGGMCRWQKSPSSKRSRAPTRYRATTPSTVW